MELLEIRSFSETDKIKQFQSVPFLVYEGNPVWSSASEKMWEGKFRELQGHPGAFTLPLVAIENGRPVARCMPMALPGAIDNQGNPQGWIGFFEVIDGFQDAARSMLQAAEQSLSGHGVQSVVMPKSDNLLVGLLTAGFDLPHFVYTNYNPAYYFELLKGCGYLPATRMVTYYFTRSRARRFKLKFPHLKTREFNRQNLEREIEIFHYLQNRIFESSPGYVLRSREENQQMVQSFLPFLEDEFVIIAETPDGDPVGLLICIPDIYQEAIDGKIDRARIMSIGAIPEFRNKGVGAIMGAHLMNNLLDNSRYMSVEGSMILGENLPVHNLVKRFGAQTGKEFWLLEKALT